MDRVADIARRIEFRYDPLQGDIDQVKELVSLTGFFTEEEIDIAGELVEEAFKKGAASGYSFVFASETEKVLEQEKIMGYGCYGPIPGTLSSYDIYWIAVMPDLQGAGAGKRILREMERLIGEAGGSRIYVETSMQEKYRFTRSFYERCGYRLDAVLDHFYSPGDGKAIYCRAL